MVKAYLRYEQARAFGVIASPEACPVYADEKGKLVVTAALERLAVWDVRRGVEHQSLIPPARESGLVPAVTKIARAPGSSLVAAGAADGSIRLWNLEDGTSDVLLKGHKSEVTALRFNASGSLLVSGGKDTNVVVWDVVAEMGLCRLRGHKDQVTDAVFVEAAPNTSGSTTKTSASNGARLVTCGKDAAVRVWDLDTQHCAQTLAHFGAECWSLDVDPRNARLVVGTADERLHVFSVAGRGGDFGGDGFSENDDDAADGDENDETAVGKRRPGSEDETKARRERDAVSIAEASALLTPMGFVRRADRSRVSTVRFDERGTFLGVQTVGRAVEVYRCRDAREMSKRLKRRAKRRREKRKADKKTEHSDESEEEEGANVLDASDVVDLAAVVRTKSKTRGFAFAPRARLKKRPGVKVVMAVLTDANAVEEWEIAGADAGDDGDDDGGSKELAEPTRARALEAAGHRADVRAAALSPNDATLVTCSHKGVKVWDPSSGSCARTIESGYGLCVVFAPGGRHVVVGTKGGALELFDVDAGAFLSGGVPDAHEGAVWGMALLPDGSGFVTASADKTVKFFEWTLAEVEEDGDEPNETTKGATFTRRELGVSHVKTLQMAEDVLSVSVTPDGKLLSVSLLDNTLKVFFTDSLKFFLSLYGHRLPALCHDVSSDSRLLASGGADKNIRVWGLDFGDCHKSLFAHDDSVTCLKFVPKTHYLFSCGKDASVKYWDADKFEPLLTLNGHHAAAWCCAMSARGDFLVTGGHDRAIRVWERTDEPFFVDEEKERRLESLLEEGDGGDDDDDDRVAAAARDAAAARGAAAPAGAEAGMAGRKTLETLSAADAIVDALDVARHERERIDAHVKKKARMALEKASMPGDEKKDADEKATRREDEKKLRRLFAGDADSEDEHDVASMKSDSDDDDSDAAGFASGAFGTNESYPKGLPPNPLLMGASPERYALRALENVKAADLERAVLALPFSSAAALLEFLGGWLERGEKTELTCRLAALIVRLHYAQLGATANARGTLLKIRPMLRARAKAFRDVVGFNLAGLGMWAARVEETAGALGGVGKKRAAGDDDDDGGDDDDDELLDDEDAGVSVPGWG